MIKGLTKDVRVDYFNKVQLKHKNLYTAFEGEVADLIKFNGTPLRFDNSTLDNLPFQNIPLIRAFYKKLNQVIKSYPSLKNLALLIKKKLS